MESYPTPHALVEALHARQGRARRQLHQLLHAPIDRLMEELIARHQLAADRDMLVVNALHLAEVTLRLRPASAFAGQSWGVFRASLLMQVAKLATEPFGAAEANGSAPPPLPDCPVYHSETFFRPHGRAGRYSFGGDWYAGHRLEDGSLWVFLADVTGHGYYAYLLAASLPHLWSLCWTGAAPTQPAELLARLHRWLEESLPEGVYVEATLARLNPDGSVVVAPGGGCRVLVRSAAGEVLLHKLRGGWLGFVSPSERDQAAWALAEGDEMLLGTDGLFDQVETAHPGPPLTESLRGPDSGRSLLGTMRGLLEQALSRAPQKDDITVVLLRRRSK
jgi:hypothetical protein